MHTRPPLPVFSNQKATCTTRHDLLGNFQIFERPKSPDRKNLKSKHSRARCRSSAIGRKANIKTLPRRQQRQRKERIYTCSTSKTWLFWFGTLNGLIFLAYSTSFPPNIQKNMGNNAFCPSHLKQRPRRQLELVADLADPIHKDAPHARPHVPLPGADVGRRPISLLLLSKEGRVLLDVVRVEEMRIVLLPHPGIDVLHSGRESRGGSGGYDGAGVLPPSPLLLLLLLPRPPLLWLLPGPSLRRGG